MQAFRGLQRASAAAIGRFEPNDFRASLAQAAYRPRHIDGVPQARVCGSRIDSPRFHRRYSFASSHAFAPPHAASRRFSKRCLTHFVDSRAIT